MENKEHVLYKGGGHTHPVLHCKPAHIMLQMVDAQDKGKDGISTQMAYVTDGRLKLLDFLCHQSKEIIISKIYFVHR